MEDPRLYVLIRSDMVSMTPGKACAQVAHAASQAAFALSGGHMVAPLKLEYQRWEQSAERFAKENGLSTPFGAGGYKGFGTTIVLDAGTEQQMYETYQRLFTIRGIDSGAIVDPTYPLRDGKKTHLINIPTCIWAFGDSKNTSLTDLLSSFPLYGGYNFDA